MTARLLFAGVGLTGLFALAGWTALAIAEAPTPGADEVAVVISGGHDTNPVDRGRPVLLIASALGVPEEVFREAFTHVRPAQGGGPTREEAQQNKRELLGRLEKYGVTNERLDEVSNFYRYRPQNNELWKHKDAVVFANVKGGQVMGYRIADGGYGYSSPPMISVPGRAKAGASAVVHFDRNLLKNGSIDSIKLAAPATKP